MPADALPARRSLAGARIAPGEDRLLTVPNLISLFRLLCIPVFLWLLFGRDDRLSAAILLGVLGATDWVDGYVARRFDQVSELGRMFDPAVDRLLLIVGISAIVVDGSAPGWFAITTIVREVLVAAWVIALTLAGAKRMDVTWYGKAQTFAMLCAYPLFLASHDVDLSDGVADAFELLAYLVAVPAVVLSIWSAALYVPLGRRALAEGRALREGGGSALREDPGGPA